MKGIRRGCVLSPMLFMQDVINIHQTFNYLKYTNDFANSRTELQHIGGYYRHPFRSFQLTQNEIKIKIMVFSRKNIPTVIVIQ